jgi:aryl-alcohol dehydrogenase-like predicted oxidoreductase
MKQRAFGSRGVNVSEIGLGCWQLGGADWGDMSEEDALATLQAAVESGVNFFDTADVYGLGHSESIIGKFLKDCPEELFVATKLGRFPEPGWPDNFTLDTFRAHTTASLRRLGIEALDLTQLHCIPTDVLKRREVFEWLRTLQQEENDHRNYNRDGQSFNVGETFAGLMFEKGVELADSLNPMVPSRLTMTQMALRWCLDYDAISVVIPGAKTSQQAAANAAVSELPPLSDQEHERVKVFYETEVVAHIRGSY